MDSAPPGHAMATESMAPSASMVVHPEPGISTGATLGRSASSQLCEQCSNWLRCANLCIVESLSGSMLSSPVQRSGSALSIVSTGSSDSTSHGGGAHGLQNTSTRASPQAQERRGDREHLRADGEMRGLKQNQRSVSSRIHPDELTATWDDKQIYGPGCDWHACLVDAPTWGQLDERTRLKLKKESATKRAAENKTKQADAKKLLAQNEEDDERADQRRTGALFASFAHASALLEDDEDLSRAESLTSVESWSSTDGPTDFQSKLALAMRHAEEEAKSGAVGANGKVLRAQWKGSVKVAIKVALGSPETIEQEIELFRDIHHPHLVACYGILEEKQLDGSIRRSIVTERCTMNLRTFLRDHDRWEYFHNERLTADDIDLRKYTILEHVSQGLQKLHDMSVLHRDLKCLNILLDGEPGECERCHHSGRWKICDFGEAKILRTPTLAFGAPKPWTSHVETGRFKPITSLSLLEQGARHYCWLHPGETAATAAGEPAGPYASTVEQRKLRVQLQNLEWEALKARAVELGLTELADERPDDLIDAVMALVVPFPFGAMVFSFSEDPNVPDDRNCVFAVAPTSESSHLETAFPKGLRPFNILPALELSSISPLSEHICLDLRNSTYTIRPQKDPAQWLPQVDCLHALYPDGIKGNISKLHPLGSTTEIDRRRMRIPSRELKGGSYLRATHYVFAYQLERWTSDEKLTANQLEQFQMHSAEISLASYGGFIYLNIDGLGKIRVVGVNALSLGPAPTYTGGATTRDDDRVTATVAAPEVFQGSSIGLEADIFSLGIVMWEVMTRRDAWHWLEGCKQPPFVIMHKVFILSLRPRVPVDVSTECATWIRRCLSTNQGDRPTAKQVGNWLRYQIESLRKHMQAQLAVKMKESDELKQQTSSGPSRGPVSQNHNWSITDRSHENSKHWNRGMYTRECIRTSQKRGSFQLTVNQDYQSDWEELALDHRSGCATTPAVIGTATEALKVQPFGIVFTDSETGGSLWPTVVKIENRMAGMRTLAPMFPQIKPGCTIVRVNGAPVPPTLKAASKMLKARPLTLEFSQPSQARYIQPWPTQQSVLGWQERSTTPAWLTAGLQAIRIIRQHEHRQMVRGKALAAGVAGVKLVAGHEQQQLQQRLAAALTEIEQLKQQLAERPGQLAEGDPGERVVKH